MMLSGAMLLDCLGDRAAGDAVRAGVREALAAGCGTPDLGLAEQVGTAEFARRVLAAVGA
jgi:isocitrate/isopropylmalate dehydrogenase